MAAMMRGELLDEFIDALQLAAEEEELSLLEVQQTKSPSSSSSKISGAEQK